MSAYKGIPMKNLWLALVTGALAVLSAAAFAQNVNIRGDITAFDGRIITVKARDGREVRLELLSRHRCAGPVALRSPAQFDHDECGA